MSQALALYQLQEIELGILRCQKRLSEIAAALEDNQAVAEARARLEAAQKTLTPLHTRARNLELEIQSNADKIRATDERLYSGSVRNPKELQDMQQEIQALKRRNAELEDTLLEMMLAVEEAEAALASARADLQQITGDWETQNQNLLDEQARLKADETRLAEQRRQALSHISAEDLKLYNALKPRRHNQPVAVLDGDTCAACGVEQTMAIISDLDRGVSLVKCMSCGRILVRKPGKA
ncbi:MAG: hypothetical protein HXY41_14620 [Chloroflexi bacterium]|nr:hypothetical protein [Chloroflexota bacterium]